MALFRRKTEVIDAASLIKETTQSGPSGEATPTTASAASSDFRLTVQDVFTIRGRGTVVTGKVESGSVAVGSQVQQSRIGAPVRTVRISGIEMFRKVVDRAAAGDNIGLLLDGVGHDDVASGDVLST